MSTLDITESALFAVMSLGVSPDAGFEEYYRGQCELIARVITDLGSYPLYPECPEAIGETWPAENWKHAIFGILLESAERFGPLWDGADVQGDPEGSGKRAFVRSRLLSLFRADVEAWERLTARGLRA
jgi:hypothetical protein